jgi:hypothetical protein
VGEVFQQISTTARPPYLLAGIPEDTGYLFIKLVTIRDDGDARMRIILQDPLREDHHDDAFATPLRVPDDAALVLAHKRAWAMASWNRCAGIGTYTVGTHFEQR